MSEMPETIKSPALSVIDKGMQITKQLDPDLARNMAKDLLAKFPDVVTNLPADVANLLIDTREGQEKISRRELQDLLFKDPENPVDWTWSQVYAYYY